MCTSRKYKPNYTNCMQNFDIWEDYERVFPEGITAPNDAAEESVDAPEMGQETSNEVVAQPAQTTTPQRVSAREAAKAISINTLLAEAESSTLSAEDQAALDAMMAPYEALARQRHEQEMLRDWLRPKIEPYTLRASDHLPPLKPVIAHKGVIIGSEGNISAVVGEAKSKKTFFCTAVVGSLIDTYNNRKFGIEHRLCKVLWIDTEQSREHIQKVLFRINLLSSMAPDWDNQFVLTQTLREEKPADRLSVMEYAIQYHQPKLVVVDGISDLMTNTNSLEESEALVAHLLTLSTQHKCHIMNVLHTNPNSDKARGHLGSTLMRKAETVIFVHRANDMSIVEPQFCRNEPFERFAFQVVNASEELCAKWPRIEGLGLPEECELPKQEQQREDDCVRILRDEFGGMAERKLLCNKLVDVLGVTPSYSRTKVARAIERGVISCNDSIVSI